MASWNNSVITGDLLSSIPKKKTVVFMNEPLNFHNIEPTYFNKGEQIIYNLSSDAWRMSNQAKKIGPLIICKNQVFFKI